MQLDPHELRVIAVDWSGARTGAARRIWLAEVVSGELTRLEDGRGREEMAAHLIDVSKDSRPVVAGLDFAFSMPAWFLRHHELASAPELWALTAREGERWLAGCETPFWGRPGKPRPDGVEQFRRGEAAYVTANGGRPKPVFQIGGSGSVGTGSVRGMPMLAELQDAGWHIWPFSEAGRATAVEIYPRALTGPVVKSNPRARADYVAREFPRLKADPARTLCSSEDAFDAGASALRMWEHRSELASLRQAADATERLEGAIWLPAPLRPGAQRA
jgi:hypothetical protein